MMNQNALTTNEIKIEEQPKPAFSPDMDDTENDEQQIIAIKETTPIPSKSHENTPEPVSPIDISDERDKKQEKIVSNEDNELVSPKIDALNETENNTKKKTDKLSKQNIEANILKTTEKTPLLQTTNSNASSLSLIKTQKEKIPHISPNNSRTDLYAEKNNKKESKWKCVLYFLPGLVLVGTGTALLFVKAQNPTIQGRINLAGFIILIGGIIASVAPIFCSCGSSTSDGNNLENELDNDHASTPSFKQ